jgi:hypothetical protein
MDHDQLPRPDVDVNVNDVVAFLVELAVVVLLAVAGFRYDGSHVTATALGIGLPLVAVVLWGAFAAPRARIDLPAVRLLVKLVVLGGGVVAGFVVLPLAWAAVVAVVVAVNLLLMYVGPFARRASSAPQQTSVGLALKEEPVRDDRET